MTGTSELDRFPDLCNLSPNTVNSFNPIGMRRNFLHPDLIGKAVNGANAWKKNYIPDNCCNTIWET